MTAPFDRRGFLKGSSAALAAGGIEGMLAARRAPAYAQGTRLHLLEWSHFIPAADTLDMFAKSIQGMPPEDAVKWADGELKRIYGA